jgi:CO/xanthine dehydrogenase Mo-binding subunit
VLADGLLPADGLLRARGLVPFVTDLALPGMLHGAVIRSPHAHAKVTGIDASAALALPGVVAVVTPADAPMPVPGEAFYSAQLSARPALSDEPCHVGQAIAAVCAEDEATAQRAARLVRVTYDTLPACVDLAAASDPGAPPVRLGRSNLALPSRELVFEHGEVDATFAGAAHVIETCFQTPTVQAAALEPYACLVRPTADGGVTVWKGAPAPWELRRQLAVFLDVPDERVRILVPPTGGGFGSRMDDLEFIAALLARKAGRPVRLVLARAEGMLAGRVRHGARFTIRSALDRDGRLLGRELRADYDTGAWLDTGPYVLLRALRPLALYPAPAMRFVGRLVHTSKPVGGATRGFGNPQATAAMELHNAHVCRTLGLDPVAFRQAHLVHDGSPNVSVGFADVQSGRFAWKGARVSSCKVKECLSEVVRRLGTVAAPAGPGTRRGIGVACAMHTSGKGRNEASEVRLEWDDGGLTVHSGAPDQGGTGVAATLALTAAEVLGLDPSTVTVKLGDTAAGLYDSGAHASGRTYVAGHAVWKAAQELKDRRQSGQPLPLIASVRHEPTTNAPPFAACGAEVEIDVETGAVRVLRLVVVADVGRVLNPVAVRGQLQGAAVQGLGFALTEQLAFDGAGRLATHGLYDYGLLRACDLPAIEVAWVDGHEPTHPLGCKGAGEIGLMPVAPALAIAVADAVGALPERLPLTPADVWHLARGS